MNMSELIIYEQIKIEQQALAVAFSTDGGINSIIEQKEVETLSIGVGGLRTAKPS